MIVATVSKGSTSGLPQSLITAQAAIHLPEVQQMLRRLSKHKLGIFMPHMHVQQTGASATVAFCEMDEEEEEEEEEEKKKNGHTAQIIKHKM